MRFSQIFDMHFKTQYDLEKGLSGNDMQWMLIIGAILTAFFVNMRPEFDANGYLRHMGWIDPTSFQAVTVILLSLLIGYGIQVLFWNIATLNGVLHGQMIAPASIGTFFLPMFVGGMFHVLRLYLF